MNYCSRPNRKAGVLASRRHWFATTAVALAAVVATLAIPLPALADTNTAVTANQLAAAIVVDPSILTGAVFDSVPPGTPNAVVSTQLASMPTAGSNYALLTTGNAMLAEQPNGSSGDGVDLGGGNFRGDSDRDVTVLRINLQVPAGTNCLLGMDFRFLSEEYPEYVGSAYNDAFIAEMDESTWTTSGSSIIAPRNFAFDPTGNPVTINAAGVTSMTSENAGGTTYDGATPLLRAATPVSPGAHILYLSIFDQGDGILDSAVMLDNLRFGAVGDPATQCKPGAVPIDTTPAGQFVSLGDSYSSGEGSYSYYPDSNDPLHFDMCHRSRKAYPVLLGADTSLGSPLFKACSGAVTDDLFNKNATNFPEPRQLSWITSATKNVTLTIGGNDADFADVLKQCINGPKSPGSYGCSQDKALRANVANRLALLRGSANAVQVKGRPVHSLLDSYRAIHEIGKTAQIYVGGYPRIFGTSGSNYTYGGKTSAKCVVGVATKLNVPLIYSIDFLDALWIDQQGNKLNGVIEDSVNQARALGIPITFVPAGLFTGHGLCDKYEPWLNELIFETNPISGDPDPASESFHPNVVGQRYGYEAAFKALVKLGG